MPAKRTESVGGRALLRLAWLLKHEDELQLQQTGVPITDMLLNVRREVRLATNDRQITWEHSALSERFYFAPPRPVVAAPPPRRPPMVANTDEEQATLARQLNRELQRVGCDPDAKGGTWTETSQAALQRFAAITKLALHTDEPNQMALEAVTSHKFIVCPLLPAATPTVPEKPVETPVASTLPPAIVPPPAADAPVAVTPPKATPLAAPRAAVVKVPRRAPQPAAPFATKIERKKTCRLETESECRHRTGYHAQIYVGCSSGFRKELCQ